jgi:hypothetical protein
MTTPSRFGGVLLALVCGLIAGRDWLYAHAFADHRVYAAAVAAGLDDPQAGAAVAAALERLGPDPVACTGGAARDVAILQLFVADRVALAAGIDPLVPAPGNAPVEAARRAALDRVAQALRCTPADGDLWLRSAVMARALGLPDADVADRLALSVRMAPAEGWIMERRAALFPGAAG